MAKVEEVKAFKSIDGEVFDTFQKAHHRNIWVITRRLFGVNTAEEDNGEEEAAMLLYKRLTIFDRVNGYNAKLAIAELAKELE